MIAIGKHVLILSDEAPVRSGKIIIPEAFRVRPAAGTIQQVGEEVEGNLRPGDRVLYERNAGRMIEEGLLVLDEDKIMIKL